MDSPITISSSESSVQNSTTPSESLDSNATFARLPNNRGGSQPYRNSTCSPKTLEKVGNWLKGLDAVNNCMESRSSSSSPSLSMDYKDRNFFHEIISLDFNNSNFKRANIMEDHPTDYCKVPAISENFVSSNQKCPEKRSPRRMGKKVQAPATKTRKHRQLLKKQVRKSEDSDSNPENVKKQELCSYLQLMKPTDKKTVMILQNRRSVRVKNLSLMQKNRDLEKKLKEEHSEENSLSRLSHDQSSSQVENGQTKRPMAGKRAHSEYFHFPKPTSNVKKTVRYFDETTQEDWFKEWKEQPSTDSLTINEDPGVTKEDTNTAKLSNYFNGKIYILEERTLAEDDLDSKEKADLPTGNCNFWKSQGLDANNRDTNHPIQIIQSICHTFSIPHPSSHFTTTVCDFDKAVKEHKDVFIKRKVIGNKCTSPRNNHAKSKSQPLTAPNPVNATCVIHPSENNIETAGSDTRLPGLVETRASSKFYRKANKCHGKKDVEDKAHLSPSIVQTVAGKELKTVANLKKKVSPLATNTCDIDNITPDVPFENDRKENRKGLSAKIKKRWKNLQKTVPVKSSQNCSFKIKLMPKKKFANFENKIKNITGKRKQFLRKMTRKTSECSREKREKASVSRSPSSSSTKKSNTRNLELPSDCPNESLSLRDTTSTAAPRQAFSSTSTNEFLSERRKDEDNFIQQYQDCEPPSTIMAVYKYKSDIQTQDYNDVGLKSRFTSQMINIDGSPKKSNQMEAKETFQVNNNEVQSRVDVDELRNNCLSISNPQTCSTTVAVHQQSSPIEHMNSTFSSFNKESSANAFYRCLSSTKDKEITTLESEQSSANWTSNSPSCRQKKDQHLIQVSKEHGPVIKVFYTEYNLVLCQATLVSFWTQTALGNVLGAQNMWIKKGSVQRLSTNNGCLFKEALEMVVSTEPSVAYIELWTKEHQSVFREGPVADVFAIVYFWKNGQSGLDKKVLQLENIKGFADDVQYSILKSSPKIIVSWHLASNGVEKKKTFVHCYQLTADFQSVCNISKFEAVEHYVSSLHNIEGCDTLIMGSGDNKITLWNIEHGYVATTIEMIDIKSTLCTLWVKCDRGFLFTLQECVDRELRIVAIHGMNHSWKKLASYVPPKNYDRLKGVCIENGIVLACYSQGIICWNAQSADMMFEVAQNEAEFISGKYIISIVNDQLNIKHAITYLLGAEEL